MPVMDRAEAGVDSRYAWTRLAASVALSTLGGVGLWSIVVALPAVQAEFGTARAAGYVLSAQATSMVQFAIIHGGLIGLLGSCATFGPLVADTSLWFRGRR